MKNSYPSVSVVIPCFNASRFVARAIRSVVSQSVCVDRIVCVDDGSTDGTACVLEKLAAEISLPMELYTLDHGGSAIARNLGLENVTGEFVQFLDADDELLPGKLAHQMELFLNSTVRVDFIAGSYLWVRRKGLAVFRHPEYLDPWVGLITTRLGITSANLWRRESVIGVGGWNVKQRSSQEYELMFRLMQRNPQVQLSHVPLTRKIEEPANISNISGQPSEQRRRNLWTYVDLRRSIAKYLDATGKMTASIREYYYLTMHERLKDLYPYSPGRAMKIHQQTIPADFRLPRDDGPGALAREDLVCSSQPYPSVLNEA